MDSKRNTLRTIYNIQYGRNKIIIYQTEDGQTQIDVRLENETVWLTQAQMAELFEKTPQNITMHIVMRIKRANWKEIQPVRNTYKFNGKAEGVCLVK